MTQSSLVKSTSLAMKIFAATSSTPLLADASNQNTNMACDNTMMRGEVAQISPTHATIKTSTLINSAPTGVWATLTDFSAMSGWSTGTLRGVTGDIKDSGSVVVTFLFGVDDAGDPISNEIPYTLIFEDGKKSDGPIHSQPTSVAAAIIIYSVQACGGKTQFTQSYEIVDNAHAANFVNQLLPGYQLFNAELKVAVEN